ncbi:MAG: DUF1206 domain-containing protein [Actinobacteria bacterium]|nr:DUF1206 domain-containing protein [Actinomycetota bacterium]
MAGQAERTAQSPWVERGARLGFVAKGLLYALVGILAIEIPLGLGGKTTDRQGALRTVAAKPFGEVLLLALALGLAGYALWRLVQAFLDRDDEGSGLKGLAKRAGYLARGVLYGGLSVLAVSIVVGAGSGGSSEQEETARVLDWPLGRWIVGAAGLGFLAAAGFNGYRAVSQKFRDDLREQQIDSAARPWVTVVGVVGHAARGVVFGLIGLFLVRAAYRYDSKEAIGLDGALRKLAQASYGSWLLGLVAAGLVAYALFCFVQARYRRL